LPPDASVTHHAVLKQFPFDADEVLGDDAFVGRCRRERLQQPLPKALKRAGLLANDRWSSGQDIGKALEVEPAGVRQR
jgi:hypothetical protein